MLFFQLVVLASAVSASSWFSAEPDYAKWSQAELRTWLEHHNVQVPPSFDKPHLYDLVDANWGTLPAAITAHAEAGRQWSIDQYTRAQRVFQHLKEDSFDQWDESKLRSFLLQHGVVAPSGPREQLVLLAKRKYRTYIDAAAFHSSLASGSLASAYASATDTVSYASQCISSTAAQATEEVSRAFDHSKDFVYSAWDDNRLRSWLEERGVMEAKSARTHDELTRLANDYYHKVTSTVWESWSDSYIREWLIAHNLLKPSDSPSRSSLLREMKKYYYTCTDNVWNTWSDSELKYWLVDHHFLKSDAQKNRDELVKMVEEHFTSASDILWGAWTDSEIRQWLSDNGYLEGRTDVKNRQDLIDLINGRYPDAPDTLNSYLVWPDPRLRAYLRERGISENALPTSRPGLLQETRILWLQTSSRTENILAKLKEIINSSVEAVEDKISRVLEVLSGHSRDAARYASEKVNGASEAHAWSWRSHKVDEVKRMAENGADSAKEKARGGDEL